MAKRNPPRSRPDLPPDTRIVPDPRPLLNSPGRRQWERYFGTAYRIFEEEVRELADVLEAPFGLGTLEPGLARLGEGHAQRDDERQAEHGRGRDETTVAPHELRRGSAACRAAR